MAGKPPVGYGTQTHAPALASPARRVNSAAAQEMIAGDVSPSIIASFTPAQRVAAASLFCRTWPDRLPEASLWEAEQEQPGRYRCVALNTTGNVIALASAWHTGAHKFRMDLVVEPGQRRRGLGNMLLEQLLTAAQAMDAATLQARAGSDNAAALEFLQRRGFRETMRMHCMSLRLESAGTPDSADIEDSLAVHGISITTMQAELMHGDGDFWGRLGEAYDAAGDEWPDPDPGGPREPLTAERVREMLNRWHVIPEALFVARHDARYVGFTGLGRANRSIGTGVHPQFRNLGIATALKLRVLDYARAHGITQLESASGNPAMLRVNGKLGFRTHAIEVRLVRRLRP